MVPMRKYRDYIEWYPEARAPAKWDDENPCVEGLFDAEIRRRIGEFIARAAGGAKEDRRAGGAEAEKDRKKDKR